MGAADFINLGHGKTAEDAFRAVRDEAAYEHGHGGYTGTIAEKGEFGYLTRTPVSEAEAYLLAEQEMQKDNGQFRDKWGPAGCIPVITGLRTITVEGVSGSVNDKEAAVKQAVADRKLLKRGETIEKVRLSSYSQPTPHYGYGYGSRAAATFSNGFATVTIKTPAAPSTRTATVTVTMKGKHFREDAEQAAREALAAGRNRLKERETITGLSLESHDRVAERTFKTTAVAPKGKTVTRYIVSGTHHDTWKTGLASQAEARAVALAAAEKAPSGYWARPEAMYEVSAVTRREDGSPLVQVARTLVKTVYTVQVSITHTPAGGTADAWLFFGYASS